MDWNDRELLANAAGMALSYAGSVDDRPTTPSQAALDALAAFDEPLTESGRDAEETLRLLADVGGPATVASTGGRYFGFVTGATYPVALGSAWLAAAWDQNAALPVMSPVAARLHDVVRAWLVDVLRLPGKPGWRSSPARPWPTPPAWLPPATSCSPGWAGTHRPTGCSARRRSPW